MQAATPAPAPELPANLKAHLEGLEGDNGAAAKDFAAKLNAAAAQLPPVPSKPKKSDTNKETKAPQAAQPQPQARCEAAAAHAKGPRGEPRVRVMTNTEARRTRAPKNNGEIHFYHFHDTNWSKKAKRDLQSSNFGLPLVIMLGEVHVLLGEGRGST